MKPGPLRAGMLLFAVVALASGAVLWRVLPQWDTVSVFLATAGVGAVALLLAACHWQLGRRNR
jgi:hypothetical protein